MIKKLSISLFLAAICPASAVGAQAVPRPNVLLVVSDDQRPDAVGALGNAAIDTPALDRLVERGTAFTRAVCPNPICTPSRAEIITGVGGMRNGVLDFGDKIRPDMPLLADTLARAGYRAGYVGKWHNDGRPGARGYQRCEGLFTAGDRRFEQTCPLDCHGRPVTGYLGWVFQTDRGKLFPERGVGLTPEISGKLADAAIRFLRDEPGRPFFLHVNFTAPHDPLLMPPGFEDKYDWREIPPPQNFLPEHPFDHGNFNGRDERLLPRPRTPEGVRRDLAAYYAVVSQMDQELGRILAALEELGEGERTIVIFTSDHGLAMGSHGLRGKQNMYEHTVGVPLIIAGPGLPEGLRSSAQCYLRDLFPTICELAGVEAPAAVEGRGLVPLIRGEREELYTYVFGHFRDKQRMIRSRRWKLIHYPRIDRRQLFDLRNDPYEKAILSERPSAPRRFLG